MASDLTKAVMKLYNSNLENRNQNQLNCNYMMHLMDEFEKVRLNWVGCEEKLQKKDACIHQLQMDILDRENQIKTLQAELRDARSQFKEQLMENGNLKSDLEDALKRLKIVQDIVKENGFQLTDHRLDLIQKPIVTRSHSVRTAREQIIEEDDTTSSIDYDRTDDSFDEGENSTRRSRGFASMAKERRSTSLQPAELQPRSVVTSKRRTRGEDHIPPKKSKESRALPVEIRQSGVRRMATRNRSMSESSIAIAIEVEQNKLRNMITPKTTSTMDLRLTPRTQIKESWLGKYPISSRPHRFERMSTYLKFTTCDVCGHGVNFATKPASKCADCHQIAHRGCERRLPLPCVPKSATPLRVRKDTQAFTLTDFCPPSIPMVAGPIIHLVTALESKGLETEGIYRVPGTKPQVSKVLNELRTARSIPKLTMQQAEVLSDCIKQFLRELRDPLIPKSSKEEFVRAAQSSDKKMLNTAICDLPQPNRDTLAYLIIHWQKVMGLAEYNKMPKENIARCVAMSVLMGQRPYPGDIASATKDTAECEKVLVELLALPSNYWLRFLTENAVEPPPNVAPNPRANISLANQSILGPVTTPNDRFPPTPRRKQYFDAP